MINKEIFHKINLNKSSFEVILNSEISPQVISDDYYEIVEKYQKDYGRLNIIQYKNLGLIDFSSERFNGEVRYIILSHQQHFK